MMSKRQRLVQAVLWGSFIFILEMIAFAVVAMRFSLQPARANLPIVAGIGALAIIAGRRHWLRNLRLDRRGAGQCVECGYDLYGSVGSVCPECGHRVVARVPNLDELL